MNDHERWMMSAIELARKAEHEGEVPVGALIIENNKIIAEGWNQPIRKNDPTAHAEIIALRRASSSFENYRLPGKTLYVTLEPCAMCCGAIFQARIKLVVFGAYDSKSGAASSIVNLFENKKLNHHTEVKGGVLEKECVSLLKHFFKGRR